MVVSFGPKPEEKVMLDLSSVPQEQAIDFLKGMDPKLQVLTKMESSGTVKEGCVIRTDPANGEELREGQTVIIWVSTGQHGFRLGLALAYHIGQNRHFLDWAGTDPMW